MGRRQSVRARPVVCLPLLSQLTHLLVPEYWQCVEGIAMVTFCLTLHVACLPSQTMIFKAPPPPNPLHLQGLSQSMTMVLTTEG